MLITTNDFDPDLASRGLSNRCFAWLAQQRSMCVWERVCLCVCVCANTLSHSLCFIISESVSSCSSDNLLESSGQGSDVGCSGCSSTTGTRFALLPCMFSVVYSTTQLVLSVEKSTPGCGGMDQKNSRAHKIKSALPPLPQNPKSPQKQGISWAWRFSCRKNAFFPGAHKIGATISGPWTASKHVYRHEAFAEWRTERGDGIMYKEASVDIMTQPQNMRTYRHTWCSSVGHPRWCWPHDVDRGSLDLTGVFCLVSQTIPEPLNWGRVDGCPLEIK